MSIGLVHRNGCWSPFASAEGVDAPCVHPNVPLNRFIDHNVGLQPGYKRLVEPNLANIDNGRLSPRLRQNGDQSMKESHKTRMLGAPNCVEYAVRERTEYRLFRYTLLVTVLSPTSESCTISRSTRKCSIPRRRLLAIQGAEKCAKPPL